MLTTGSAEICRPSKRVAGAAAESRRSRSSPVSVNQVPAPTDGAQSQDPAKLTTTTVRDYDLAETSKAIRGVLIGIAMTGGMRASCETSEMR